MPAGWDGRFNRSTPNYSVATAPHLTIILEKIFQIPFWLDRLETVKTRLMLRGLAAVSPVRTAQESTGVQPGARRDGGPTPTLAVPPGITMLQPPVSRAAIAQSEDPTPAGLEILPHELAAMERLAPMLGRSPRALKRFMNVYRLIKVRTQDTSDFAVAEDTDYRIVLYLLAGLIGQPGDWTRTVDKIRNAGDDDPIDAPEGWPDTIGPYKAWIGEVGRYAFTSRSVQTDDQ